VWLGYGLALFSDGLWNAGIFRQHFWCFAGVLLVVADLVWGLVGVVTDLGRSWIAFLFFASFGR
jgi:hypothetical protein